MKKVITESALQAKIIQLANAINQSEKHSKTPVVFVGILNGAFMFFSDLVKYIKFPIEIDFVRVKSYDGQNRKEIKFIKDLETDINGKHVYLVDDIIDSGHTMKFLIDHFEKRGATNVTPVAAIYKENGDFEKVLHILYQDVDTIFDPWYIGYGMDYDKGHNRNLSTIYTI